MTSRGILLDVTPALLATGGIPRYVHDLHRTLLDESSATGPAILLPRTLRGEALRQFPSSPRRELPFDWRVFRATLMLGTRVPLPWASLYGAPQLLLSPMGYGPALRGTRMVLTVHDLTGIEHPEWHPRAVAAFTRATLPHAARSAHTILCDSRAVAEALSARFPEVAARVVVVPLGRSSHLQVPTRDEAERVVHVRFADLAPYILQVGTLEPRKNHVVSIAAFESLARRGFPGRLVLAGREGWHVRPIRARIESSSVRDRIVVVTDVRDHELSCLYRLATATVMPSLDEGFGLPLLEAMSHGSPALCSDHGALAELAGNGAWMLPAMRWEPWADALETLWRDADVAQRWAAAGLRRAGEFTHERFARRMRSVYSAVLSDAPVSAALADQ